MENEIANASARQDELLQQVGGILFRCARKSALEEKGDENLWDYGVYVFCEGSGDVGLFYQKQTIRFELLDDLLELIHAMEEFKGLMCGDLDKPWIKCKLAIANENNGFKMLFEYNDQGKWNIGPANLAQQYEILLSDIYPEALSEKPKIVKKSSLVNRLFGRSG